MLGYDADNDLLVAMTSRERFKIIGESVAVVTGLILVVCVLAFRRGIMGEIATLRRKRR